MAGINDMTAQKTSLRRIRISLNSEFLAFLITLVVVILTFSSFVKDALGTKALLIGCVLLAAYWKRIANDVIPSFFFMIATVIMFLLSGQIWVRGFNAPIGHMMKFVYFFLTIVLASIFPRLKEKHKRLIFIALFAVVIISIVVSLYYVSAVDIYAIRYYEERGFTQVFDFNQLYSLPILFSVVFCFMIASFKAIDLKRKIFYIAFLVLSAWCIFRSLYTFALLLMVFGVGVALFMYWEKKSKTKLFLICLFGVIALILVFLFAQPVSDFLYDLTEDWNWIVRARVMSVVDEILGTSHSNWYTSERRDELAGYSLATFKAHPLVGVGYSGYEYGVIGCHQEWYDMLGVFGLFGTAFVIIVFVYSSIKIYRKITTKIDRACFLTALILFIVLGFLNPCICMPILLVVYVIAPNMSVLLGSIPTYRQKKGL